MGIDGIGTDATRPEHTKIVTERGYAAKNLRFIRPTGIGMSLLGSVGEADLKLAPP
jgi:DNA topoisomerase IA